VVLVKRFRGERAFEPPPGSYRLAIGEQPFVRRPQTIWLTPGLRAVHALVVGQTGSGKTKLLEGVCRQMIQTGQGFCLLDLHGDLSRDLRDYVEALPEPLLSQALARLRFVDVDDPFRVAPFNPLEAADEAEAATVLLEVIAAFRRHWSDSWGPRMADLMTQTLAVLQANGLTLAEVPLFLGDKAVRAKLLAHPKVGAIQRDYFRFRYDCLSRRDQVLMSESTLNKVGALLSDERVRTFLGSTETTLRPREAISKGQIVLARIPRGSLVENADVVAALVLAAFHTAALARVSVPPERRRPYVLVLDEAQIASETFPQLLAGARAFGLSAVAGIQFLDQLPRELGEALLANTRVRVGFRLSRRDAETLCREFFRADGDHVKHQDRDLLGSRASRPMFWSVSEEWEYRIRAFQDQDVGECVIQLERGQPWFAQTWDVPPAPACPDGRAALVMATRRTTVSRERIATAIRTRRSHLTTNAPKGGDPHDDTDDAIESLA
jgi:hypothetical protein